MEVKIKNQNELIEADWTIEDGVMVVSPKDIKMRKIDLTQFKDGDILYCSWGYKQTEWVAILKGEVDYMDNTHVFMEDYCSLFLTGDNALEVESFSDSATFVRHATEEEKKRLFDKLAEEGLEWDAEKKQLVKLKWKPSVGQHFYYPEYDNRDCAFIIKAYTYAFEDQIERDKAIAKGWSFKTSKECQEFCNRLNKATENIKP